jgi:hypothetical protein
LLHLFPLGNVAHNVDGVPFFTDIHCRHRKFYRELHIIFSSGDQLQGFADGSAFSGLAKM